MLPKKIDESIMATLLQWQRCLFCTLEWKTKIWESTVLLLGPCHVYGADYAHTGLYCDALAELLSYFFANNTELKQQTFLSLWTSDCRGGLDRERCFCRAILMLSKTRSTRQTGIFCLYFLTGILERWSFLLSMPWLKHVCFWSFTIVVYCLMKNCCCCWMEIRQKILSSTTKVQKIWHSWHWGGKVQSGI